MFNVDTITLAMSTEKYCTKRKGRWYYEELDYEYTKYINNKITSKLWLDKESKKIKREQDELFSKIGAPYPDGNIYYHGIYDNYVFNFNETWNYLTIMLPHDKVEVFAEPIIITECEMTILEFFDLIPDDLNELVLNRLDVKCDFHYNDLEEFEIIKNILAKAPDKLYSYQKRLLKNDDEGYILTYSAIRKNDRINDLFEIGG